MKKYFTNLVSFAFFSFFLFYCESNYTSGTDVRTCDAVCCVDYTDWACHNYAGGFYCKGVKKPYSPSTICDECVVSIAFPQ